MPIPDWQLSPDCDAYTHATTRNKLTCDAHGECFADTEQVASLRQGNPGDTRGLQRANLGRPGCGLGTPGVLGGLGAGGVLLHGAPPCGWGAHARWRAAVLAPSHGRRQMPTPHTAMGCCWILPPCRRPLGRTHLRLCNQQRLTIS